MVKYTKNCLLPWNHMLIHAGGLMQICACGSDIDIGDFILDYCEKKKRGEETDIFNSEGIQAVRKGLLTGDMREMCRNCAFESSELIPVEELQQKLIEYLESRDENWKYHEGMDLTKEYSYCQLGISLTNRCNLRCMYCNQSTCAETNPFYKVEFPTEFVEDTMELLAKQRPVDWTASVEGEATIYKNWYSAYSKLIAEHPDIHVLLTTNLNKHYTEEEIELLARHSMLDISCDTLDPELYGKIRVNGKLELLLENLQRIEAKVKELGLKRPQINFHVVVCNLTWRSLPAIAEYAFAHKYNLNIGNYEERLNALGYQNGMLKTVYTLSNEEQEQLYNILEDIKKKGKEAGIYVWNHGDISYRLSNQVQTNYNTFVPVEKDSVNYRFYEKYPHGTREQHLTIVYDYDNTSYPGIIVNPGWTLELDGLTGIEQVELREVYIYKDGTDSGKYGQTVLPGYRRLVSVKNGRLVWKASQRENVEKILICIEKS